MEEDTLKEINKKIRELLNDGKTSSIETAIRLINSVNLISTINNPLCVDKAD